MQRMRSTSFPHRSPAVCRRCRSRPTPAVSRAALARASMTRSWSGTDPAQRRPHRRGASRPDRSAPSSPVATGASVDDDAAATSASVAAGASVDDDARSRNGGDRRIRRRRRATSASVVAGASVDDDATSVSVVAGASVDDDAATLASVETGPSVELEAAAVSGAIEHVGGAVVEGDRCRRRSWSPTTWSMSMRGRSSTWSTMGPTWWSMSTSAPSSWSTMCSSWVVGGVVVSSWSCSSSCVDHLRVDARRGAQVERGTAVDRGQAVIPSP